MTKCKNCMAQCEQMVKNCPNPTRKAGLEVSLAGGRLDYKPVANEGGKQLKSCAFKGPRGSWVNGITGGMETYMDPRQKKRLAEND